MTKAELEAIEARAQAATDGPWVTGSIPWQVWHDGGGGKVCRIESKAEDREFIAHARQDVPALVREVWALRNDLQRALPLLPHNNFAHNIDRTADPYKLVFDDSCSRCLIERHVS